MSNYKWVLSLFALLFLIGCQNASESPKDSHESENPSSQEQQNAAKNQNMKLPDMELLVTNSQGDDVSFINPAKESIEKLQVGIAPHGVTLAPDHRAYVATAEGIAVIDTKQRKRIDLVPYQADIDELDYGEYREGGMGIATSPDGRYVYAGVYLQGGNSQLAVLDTKTLKITKTIPVGDRPFQVLVSQDGHNVYTIDHDSYSVTVVHPKQGKTKTIEVTPLGGSAFAKPHYAAIAKNGHLLLPFQGKSLIELDPKTGKSTTKSLTANTHQHGMTLTPNGDELLIVGTGPAGNANENPKLSIIKLDKMKSEHIPLEKRHENVVATPNGKWGILTGGYTFANRGWDGLTFVNLNNHQRKAFKVPDRPLDIEILGSTT